MLHIYIILLTLFVLAWILPWRDLKIWRATIILAVFASITLIAYEYRGFSDGLAAKQALNVFEDHPNEKRLAKVHGHLDKHIQKHPDDGLAYVILGRLYFAEQDFTASADAFAKAYVHYENDSDLWVEYAAALLMADTDPEMLNDLVKRIARLEKNGGDS